MSYSIIVHNKQGAASGHNGETQGEINRWLNGWSDPENLSGTVKDETGDIVGVKEIGKKRIQWYAKNEAAVSLGRKGGLVKSPRKAGTSAENGRLGGRPKKSKDESEA